MAQSGKDCRKNGKERLRSSSLVTISAAQSAQLLPAQLVDMEEESAGLGKAGSTEPYAAVWRLALSATVCPCSMAIFDRPKLRWKRSTASISIACIWILDTRGFLGHESLEPRGLPIDLGVAVPICTVALKAKPTESSISVHVGVSRWKLFGSQRCLVACFQVLLFQIS